MSKTELKKKTLSELEESLDQGGVGLQSVGGGDGSYGNPYSEAEYNALVTAGYFTGGYVELDGEVLWSLSPAYCDSGTSPGGSWVNVLLSYASASFDAGGQVAQQSPWTVRFTNSTGRVDFRCYTNGWSGTQYVNNYQPFGAGKVLRVSGIGNVLSNIAYTLGAANLVISFYDFFTAQSPDERWSAIIDVAACVISFVPYGVGAAFSIAYSSGLDSQIKSAVLSYME